MIRLLAAALFVAVPAGATSIPELNRAQSQYLLRCGGCHGTTGVSPPKSVPMLRDMVGWFLCTPAGRAYIIRLPNVAQQKLSDADLAAVMNFTTFELGGSSVPKSAVRFTEAEVRQIRSKPLVGESLLAHRARVVSEMMRVCGAPKALLEYGAPPRETAR